LSQYISDKFHELLISISYNAEYGAYSYSTDTVKLESIGKMSIAELCKLAVSILSS